jgi:hypothetical protein
LEGFRGLVEKEIQDILAQNRELNSKYEARLDRKAFDEVIRWAEKLATISPTGHDEAEEEGDKDLTGS